MLAGDNGDLTKLADDDRLHTTYHCNGTIALQGESPAERCAMSRVLKAKVAQPDGSTVEGVRI